MRVRKIENKESLTLEIQNELSKNEDAKYHHRLDLVLLAINGMPIKEIVRIYGEPQTTINTWVKNAVEKGIESLCATPNPGRPPRLTQAQLSELEIDLQKSPLELDYDFSIWDGNLLSEHILRKYNIVIKTRQCQRIMKQLGFTMQRPQTKPSGGDAEAQTEFKKT